MLLHKRKRLSLGADLRLGEAVVAKADGLDVSVLVSVCRRIAICITVASKMKGPTSSFFPNMFLVAAASVVAFLRHS